LARYREGIGGRLPTRLWEAVQSRLPCLHSIQGNRQSGRVEKRRGGCRPGDSCCRRLSRIAGVSVRSMAPSPFPAHRTGRADFPHRRAPAFPPESEAAIARLTACIDTSALAKAASDAASLTAGLKLASAEDALGRIAVSYKPMSEHLAAGIDASAFAKAALALDADSFSRDLSMVADLTKAEAAGFASRASIAEIHPRPVPFAAAMTSSGRGRSRIARAVYITVCSPRMEMKSERLISLLRPPHSHATDLPPRSGSLFPLTDRGLIRVRPLMGGNFPNL